MKLIAKFVFVYIAMMINVGCASMSPGHRGMLRGLAQSWSEQRAAQNNQNSQLRYIQSQRQTSTTCESTVGYTGGISTNCTSKPSGIDTSMYGN